MEVPQLDTEIRLPVPSEPGFFRATDVAKCRARDPGQLVATLRLVPADPAQFHNAPLGSRWTLTMEEATGKIWLSQGATRIETFCSQQSEEQIKTEQDEQQPGGVGGGGGRRGSGLSAGNLGQKRTTQEKVRRGTGEARF
jgi:hypothetical protein